MEHDTIAALSTPQGRGGIGIIRISGSHSFQILKKIVRLQEVGIEPRKIFHGFLYNKNKKYDECLYSFFRSPHSFTGEDIVEISLHANPILIEETLQLLLKHGARLALPGEFSYRAFKNGKIDLLQAEAINDLINANSRFHSHLKFASLQGKLSKKINDVREKIKELAVQLETIIEFQEDQELGVVPLIKILSSEKKKLKDILQIGRFSEVIGQGIKIVIAGRVNVGKSTLFNALLQEERSIISPFPGTTRDFINEKMYIEGIPLEIYDVAGIQFQGQDRIENEGMSRSMEKINEADAILLLLDATQKINQVDQELYSQIKKKNHQLIINKIDLASSRSIKQIMKFFPTEICFPISAKKGNNLESIKLYLKSLLPREESLDTNFAINLRQRDLLEKLLGQLEIIEDALKQKGIALDLIAEEIRTALKFLGELTGEISSDDLLNEIFNKFCIGK